MYFFFLVKAKQIFKMVTALVFIRKIYWVFRKRVSLEFYNAANFTPLFSICIYLLLLFIPTLLIIIDIKGANVPLFFKISFGFISSLGPCCPVLTNTSINLYALGFIFYLRGRRGLVTSRSQLSLTLKQVVYISSQAMFMLGLFIYTK